MSYNPENRPAYNPNPNPQGSVWSGSNPVLDALNSTQNFFSSVSAEPLPPPQAPRLPTPAVSTFCFFLAILLFEGLGILLQSGKVSSIMITIIGEIGLIAALPLIFTGLGRYDFRAVFSVRTVPLFTVFLCVVTGLAAQLAIIFPNALGIWVLQQIGPLYLPPDSETNLMDNGTKLLFSLAALVLAPLCEETLNRGFLMAGYKSFGLTRTILVIGILFGLFHMYPYKFVGTGLGGIILAYLAYTTGSIYASMAAHFGFNLLPTIILWISDPLRRLFQNGSTLASTVMVAKGGDIEVRVDGSTVVTSIIISGVGLALLLLMLRIITRRTARVRPGLVLNYFGLATRIIENSPIFQSGPYYGPNEIYSYGDFGYSYRAAPPFQSFNSSSVFSGQSANPAGFAPNVSGWQSAPANPYAVTNEGAKVAPNSQKAGYERTTLVAVWLLVLLLYMFGAYQELVLREIGRDCELRGLDACESKLSGTVSPTGTDTATSYLLVNAFDGLPVFENQLSGG